MWPKGSQASCGDWREDSGLLSRPCRKRRPSYRDDGGVLCIFSMLILVSILAKICEEGDKEKDDSDIGSEIEVEFYVV